eukprot:m.1183451 g.1183451  ORF g.1183451 m.1183451 type:complete len:139 (+) comp24540_c1_seq57:626-1042(+)
MHVARLCGPLTMFLNVLTGFSVKVPWPMQLMFNEEAIAKYNSLFSFLLRVNRLQYGLHRVWADNMRRIKRNRVADKTSTNARLLSLRARMSFLVDNLQVCPHQLCYDRCLASPRSSAAHQTCCSTTCIAVFTGCFMIL